MQKNYFKIFNYFNDVDTGYLVCHHAQSITTFYLYGDTERLKVDPSRMNVQDNWLPSMVYPQNLVGERGLSQQKRLKSLNEKNTLKRNLNEFIGGNAESISRRNTRKRVIWDLLCVYVYLYIYIYIQGLSKNMSHSKFVITQNWYVGEKWGKDQSKENT